MIKNLDTHPDYELVKEIPVYLIRPDTSKYYLARYPSQIKREITTLGHASSVKMKPKQSLFQINVPLYDDDNPLISSNNCDMARLNVLYKNDNTQKLEGNLQKNNQSQQLFIAQIACEENEDAENSMADGNQNPDSEALSLHITPINGGTIFFRPKQTIYDEIDEERKKERKKIAALDKAAAANEGMSTDDDEEAAPTRKPKSQMITKKFDRSKVDSLDSMKKGNIKKWKDYLAILNNEAYVNDIPVTRVGSTKSVEIRDTEMICQSQSEVLVEHQSYEEYWEKQFACDSNVFAGSKDKHLHQSPSRTKKDDKNLVKVKVESKNEAQPVNIVDLFIRRIFNQYCFVSTNSLRQYEQEIGRQITQEEIDSYCHVLFRNNSGDNSLICLKSSFCWLATDIPQKKKSALQASRNLILSILMNQNQILEANHLSNLQLNYQNYFPDATLAKVNKDLRDLMRDIGLKKSSDVNGHIWKIDGDLPDVYLAFSEWEMCEDSLKFLNNSVGR